MRCHVRFLFALLAIYARGETDEDTRESETEPLNQVTEINLAKEDNDIDFGDYNITSTNYTHVSSTDPDHDLDSGEHIGASVTQIFKHPYAASLLKNKSYECSAIILNTYWTVTLSKCFDTGPSKGCPRKYHRHKYFYRESVLTVR